MAGRPRSGQMVLWWKSRKVMSKRPSCSGDGAVAYIGVWSMNSFLDSETLREREGREREIQNELLRSGSGPNLALRDGRGFRIRPLFGAGAKGVESGVKGRQIRRPFHSDCDLLRRLGGLLPPGQA